MSDIDIDKTWIAPSGMKSWSVFKRFSNGMVVRVGTYRSMRRAAEVEIELHKKP
jgi:hypothetical protein